MSDAIPPSGRRTPWWMTILIVICMLPVLAFPFAISGVPADNTAGMLVWFYPAYVLCAGICAWITYPKRPEVTWILIVLMLLTHAGMYILVEGL